MSEIWFCFSNNGTHIPVLLKKRPIVIANVGNLEIILLNDKTWVGNTDDFWSTKQECQLACDKLNSKI